MTLKERLEWIGRMTLLVFILASAAFLSALSAMRIAIQGREVTMPNLVGRNVSEASQMLRSKGLYLRIVDRIYSDQPINVVVRQTPPPGMLMKEAQQAHVILSLGQRQVQIPALQGDSLRVARIELLREGLQVGEISGIYVQNAAADTIIQQNPKPGAGGATPRVDLLVSGGSEEAGYVMPRLIGLLEADAQRRLDQAGIKRKVNYVTAPQWPHSAVIDQSPMPGTRLDPSVIVQLTIAN
jgi:eukaryotic-like serine/threonine-protein kinase